MNPENTNPNTPQDMGATQVPAPQPTMPAEAGPAPIAPAAPAAPTAAAPSDYMSNPFTNAARGLATILQKNPVSILMISFWLITAFVVGYIALLFSIVAGPVGMIIAFLVWVIMLLALYGASFASGAASLRNETISTGDAVSTGFAKFLPLLGLYIMLSVIYVIGFILLIVPGFILMGRLNLSLYIMFAENLGPIAAMKRSWELTKGHVFEMWGTMLAVGLFSGGAFGLLTSATIAGPIASRYQDLKALKDSGAAKPKTHWLNYLSVALVALFIGLMVALVAISVSSIEDSVNQLEQQSQTELITDESFDASDFESDLEADFDYEF